MREGHEHIRGSVRDQLADTSLMGIVDERPQERDGDSLDVESEEALDSRYHVDLVEGDDDVAVAVDTFRHASYELSRHDRVWLLQPRGVQDLALTEPCAFGEDLADRQ